MFTCIRALLPFAALVAASHVGVRGQTASQCNTGTLSCCENVQTAEQASNVLAANNLLDVVGEVFGLVGTQCTPITGIGAGTACAAQQQPVCCTDNDMNGLINWGCSPININA